jgi:hypothetical protein
MAATVVGEAMEFALDVGETEIGRLLPGDGFGNCGSFGRNSMRPWCFVSMTPTYYTPWPA